MNNLLLLSVFIFSTFCNAQIANIPNGMFKTVLLNDNCADLDGDGIADSDVDTNDDGLIQISEAEAVLALYLAGKFIDDIEGIHYFTNMTELAVHNNLLQEIDITQNTTLEILHCSGNELSEIDVSNNTNLKFLNVFSNQLTSLDVSQNIYLEDLSCGGYPFSSLNLITSLDLSNNINLKYLNCYNNLIESLDFSQNINIEELHIGGNPLSSVDVSQNPHLRSIIASSCELTELNLKNGNNANFEIMWIIDNPFLFCVEVDDPAYSEANWPDVDPQVEFSLDCDQLVIDDNFLSDVVVYPNPTSDFLFIDSMIKIDSLRLVDISGKEHINADANRIDLSNLPSGIYFIRITLEDDSYATRRIIKK